MTKTCPECGYPVPSNIQTCPECGYPFPVEQTTTQKQTTSNTINSSTRYQTLSREQVNLYTKGSPIIISAMALLKDNVTGQIIGQVKYQNISAAPVKALIINAKAFDVMGQELEGIQKFQYLDLDVKRDDFFGANIPIIFPDSQTRIFSIEILNVLTGFGSVQDLSGMSWNKLKEPVRINQKYNDSEFIKQYSIELGSQAKYEYHNEEDLWYCVCGTYNRQTEPLCHSCNISREKLLQTEFDAINAQKEKRLQKEEQARLEQERHWEEQRLKREQEKLEQEQFLKEQKEKKALKRKKIIKRITLLLLVIILIALAILGFPKAKAYLEPKITEYQYNKALSLIDEGQYEKGYEILLNGEYSDAEELVRQNKYDRAVSLVSEKKYEEAYLLLEELGNFSDAKEQLVNAKCAQAIEYQEVGDYNSAVAVLSELGGTIKSDDLDNELKYLMAKMDLEQGNYSSAVYQFEKLKNYKDSRDLLNESQYLWAKQYVTEENFEKSTLLFRVLGDYKDSKTLYESSYKENKYRNAVHSMENKTYHRAAEHFRDLGNYKDSAQLLKECEYNKGLSYIESEQYDLAIHCLDSASDYKGAAEKKAEAQNLLDQEKKIAAEQAAKRAAEQKAAQEAQQKALLEQFKKGKAINYTTRNDYQNRTWSVHSVTAILTDNESNYKITVDCTLPKDSHASCFNPPKGTIFNIYNVKANQGRSSYTFTVPREKIKSSDSITILFWVNGSKEVDRGCVFIQTSQLY